MVELMLTVVALKHAKVKRFMPKTLLRGGTIDL